MIHHLGIKNIPQRECVTFDYQTGNLYTCQPFINETFGNCHLKGIVIDGQIHFENCQFEGYVELEKITAEKISFRNCVFKFPVILKNIEGKISLVDCYFQRNVTLYWNPTSTPEPIEILRCELFGNLIVNGFNESKFVLDTTMANSILIDEQSDDCSISVSKCELRSLKIHNSVVDNLDIKESKIYRDLVINKCRSVMLKSSEIGNISSDDKDFWLFLKGKKFEGPLFKSRTEDDVVETEHELWTRVSNSLLVFVSSFNREHRYGDADTTYYLMRKARTRAELSGNADLPQKIKVNSKRIFLGWVGGWGVKIMNPFLTCLIVILTYSIFYIFAIYGDPTNKSFLEIMLQGLYVSVCRFYNLGDDLYKKEYLWFLEIQEGIIGIILNTLLIGMLIRKLIR
jgi:hypothetical protein